jgi:hypothetical protein
LPPERACATLGVRVTDASRTPRCYLVLAPTCLGLALALSACGGGSRAVTTLGASTTITKNPRALTAAEYRKKANAICLSIYRKKIPKGTAGLVAVLADGRAADSSLEALHPPASLARLNARLIRVEKGLAAYVATLVKEQKGGKKLTLSMLLDPRFVQLGGEEDRLWTKLGVTVCANGPLARYTR